jgi:hypothetical protein
MNDDQYTIGSPMFWAAIKWIAVVSSIIHLLTI